jgi:hypothetical protein
MLHKSESRCNLRKKIVKLSKSKLVTILVFKMSGNKCTRKNKL